MVLFVACHLCKFVASLVGHPWVFLAADQTLPHRFGFVAFVRCEKSCSRKQLCFLGSCPFRVGFATSLISHCRVTVLARPHISLTKQHLCFGLLRWLPQRTVFAFDQRDRVVELSGGVAGCGRTQNPQWSLHVSLGAGLLQQSIIALRGQVQFPS